MGWKDPEPHTLPWRVGRKVGRTIYAELPGVTSDPNDDPLIGVMDTRELAAEAVEAHNAKLLRAQADSPSRGQA